MKAACCTASRGLSMFAPHAYRSSMCRQSFGFGETFDRWGNLSQSFGRELLHGNHLHEIHHTQTSAKSRLPCSRQHVVRTGGIIARGLRRVVAYEDRTRIVNERQVLRADRDVFRCEAIRPLSRLFARCGNQDRSAATHRFLRNRIALRELLDTASRQPERVCERS